ncbi:AAA family ATPase [Streptomyces sp. NPDC056883]|uniref:AAA family ATPase n=1 Tax=Streptomyces sp. NPDC056883 TaxID=3345959 RepID=UPI0036BB74E7
MAQELLKYSVTYGGRAHELTPSGGEVILPRSGVKIHHSSSCWHLTDSGDLPTHPDPDGVLWRRLLDASDPAAFSASRGLVNGMGKPLTGVCSCALRAVTDDHADSLPYWPLDAAFAAFDPDAHGAAVEAADHEAARFRERFPWEEWPTLSLDRYALGQQPDLPGPFYSRDLEYGSKPLGSITGGSAYKHFVFRRRDGVWWHDTKYPDAATAWEAVRAGIVEAVEAARAGRVAEIDDIAAIASGVTVVAKTLRIYAPDAILPVYADHLTRHYLSLAGGDAYGGLRPFARKQALRRLFLDREGSKDWPPQLVLRFLLWWAPLRVAPRIVRIGIEDGVRIWPQCLAGGYLAVRHEAIGDLHAFVGPEEATEASGSGGVPGSGLSPDPDSIEDLGLWDLIGLRAGDRVVAMDGRNTVLGVGQVTGEGYRWRPDLTGHRHTVSVDWSGTYSGVLDPPAGDWGPWLVTDVRPKLWGQIQALRTAGAPEAVEAEPELLPPLDAGLRRISDALDRRGQAVLYGPPGTGKTRQALRFAVRRLGELSDDLPGLHPAAEPGDELFGHTVRALTAAGRLTLVTFHPGYGYEDFIEGLRPRPGSTGLSLETTAGVFKEVCTRAAADPGHPYLVVVDELNRADLPKVLGELITVIEKDKRGMAVTLPLSKEAFCVPRNVQLLGTMNTSDRSIRQLDSAVRRRFAFLELLPDAGPLHGSAVDELDLGVFLDALNDRIRRELDREKQIGQAFFLPGGTPVATAAELASVIRDEILPLLQEYAYDDYGLLTAFLGEDLVDPVSHTLRELSDEKLVSCLYEEFQVGAGAPSA